MNDCSVEWFSPLVDQAVVLTGATASGKSALAVAVAEEIDAEILSLDSIAVYCGMDIGTAKPDAAERARVPHHLIDLVTPDKSFSVACYLRAAHAAVAEVRARGRIPLFVGGTPMFLKGVLRGFDPGPPADWEFRAAVEADIAVHGVEKLRERLMQVDPLAAHRIDPNDVRRTIRALEVARLTGVPLSHRQTQFERQRDAEHALVFAVGWPREQLHERIEQRVAAMFRAGLVDEVRGLIERYGELSRTAGQAVGYREVLELLRGKATLAQARQDVLVHTRQLARRQETWLRSLSEIRAIPLAAPSTSQHAAQEIVQMIQQNRRLVGAS